MTQTIHRAIGAAATAILLALTTTSCGDAGAGGAVGSGVAVPVVETPGSAAGDAPVLTFTVRPEATTASLDLLWRVEVTPSPSSPETSPVAAAAASILSVACEVNRLPVSCLRVDVNAYEIRHRATPGDVHLEVLVRTARGDLLTATSDHVVTAVAVSGPTLTFTAGPEAGGGLKDKTRFLDVSFRVASDRLLASAGLSCTVNGLPTYCALELPARAVVVVSGVVGGAGTHTVAVTARDQLGHPTTVTRAFTVDRTAPGFALSGAGQTIDVLADAAGVGCFETTVAITGEASGWRYDVQLNETWVSLGVGQTSLSFCRRYNGYYTVRAAAFDDAGNQSAVLTVSYRILARYQTSSRETTYAGRVGYFYPTPVSTPATPAVGSLLITADLFHAGTYAQAAAACATIALDGVTGWRLPTAAEAAAFHQSGFGLYTDFGSGGFYEIWTSTLAGAGSRATAVIYDGTTGVRAETASSGARCVREVP
jgi:hypothetical protein